MILLAIGIAGPIAGCASAAHAPGGADAVVRARVTGTVAYRDRVALPPTAVITVQLVDVSRADAAAVVLGEQRIDAGGGQVPFSFAIAYDPAKIDERMIYAVRARIEHEGRLLFINDQRSPVITRGAPTNVNMWLNAVGGNLQQ